jgi:hypothetical protein
VGLTSPFWGGPGGPGGPCLGSEAKPKAPGVPGVPALVPAPLGKPGKFHQWRNFHQQKWLWNLKVENVTASLWKTRIPSCNFTRSIGPFSSMIYLSNCWFSWTFHISDYYRDLQGIYRVSVMVIQDADAHGSPTAETPAGLVTGPVTECRSLPQTPRQLFGRKPWVFRRICGLGPSDRRWFSDQSISIQCHERIWNDAKYLCILV